MFTFFRKVAKDIEEHRYLEHYFTLGLVLLILVLDTLGLADSEVLTKITLTVLALIVFTSIATNDNLNSVRRMLDKPSSADSFFWTEEEPLGENIRRSIDQAKHIGLVGATLSMTIRNYSARLEKKLAKEGTKIQVIVIDPESDAPEQAVLRSKGIDDKQFYINLLIPTLERIGVLSAKSDAVSLGLLPFMPAFGMIVLDPDEPRGKIIVEMYPHKSTDLFPTFELLPDRDPYWYDHFRQQFDILWKSCGDRKWQGKAVQNFVVTLRNGLENKTSQGA